MAGIKLKNGEPYSSNQTVDGGAYGVWIYGGTPPYSATNLGGGKISASNTDGVGILLDGPGVVTNAANAGVYGGGTGVEITGVGVVTNSGTITGTTQNAVDLFDGGSVTNLKGGLISGGSGAFSTVSLDGSVADRVDNRGEILSDADTAVTLGFGGSVVNSGTISTQGAFSFEAGIAIAGVKGTVDNLAGGRIIASGQTIAIESGPGTITNAGFLKSTKGVAVTLERGGHVTNAAHANITSMNTAVGVIAAGVPGGGVNSVTNFGSISSTKGAGVSMTFGDNTVTNKGSIRGAIGVVMLNGGTVNNEAGASIAGVGRGGSGVFLVNGGSVIDRGEISGAFLGHGASVVFSGQGTFTLSLGKGASLYGAADGSTAKDADSRAYLSGAGKAADGFVNFNSLVVDATGTWKIGGTSIVAELTLAKGALQLDGKLITRAAENKGATLSLGRDGVLFLKKTSTFKGSVTGTGVVDIAANASAAVFGEVAAGDTFAFAGARAELELDDLGAKLFHGKIGGFGRGDNLDVGAPFGAGTTLNFAENAGHASGVLTLSHGAIHASLTLLGAYSEAHFHIAPDGHGGSHIVYL